MVYIMIIFALKTNLTINVMNYFIVIMHNFQNISASYKFTRNTQIFNQFPWDYPIPHWVRNSPDFQKMGKILRLAILLNFLDYIVGVGSKMKSLIQSMYYSVCVWVCLENGLSSPLWCTKGVKQGCTFSFAVSLTRIQE